MKSYTLARASVLIVAAVLGCCALFCEMNATAAPPDTPGDVQIVLRRNNPAGTPIDSTDGKRIRCFPTDLDTTGHGYEFTYSLSDSFGFWHYMAGLPSGHYDFYILNGGLCSLLVNYHDIPIYNCVVCDSCIVDSLAFAGKVIPWWAYKDNSVGPNAVNDTAAYRFGDIEVDSTLRVGSYNMPMADGDSASVLTTDGAGTVSWEPPEIVGRGIRPWPLTIGEDRVYCPGVDSGSVVLCDWYPILTGVAPYCSGTGGGRGIAIHGFCTKLDTFYVWLDAGCVSWAAGDTIYQWVAYRP